MATTEAKIGSNAFTNLHLGQKIRATRAYQAVAKKIQAAAKGLKNFWNGAGYPGMTLAQIQPPGSPPNSLAEEMKATITQQQNDYKYMNRAMCALVGVGLLAGGAMAACLVAPMGILYAEVFTALAGAIALSNRPTGHHYGTKYSTAASARREYLASAADATLCNFFQPISQGFDAVETALGRQLLVETPQESPKVLVVEAIDSHENYTANGQKISMRVSTRLYETEQQGDALVRGTPVAWMADGITHEVPVSTRPRTSLQPEAAPAPA